MNTSLMKIGTPGEYVDTETLAKLKGVTLLAVQEAIRRGRIRAVKLGDRWAIPKTEIEGYLKARPGRPKIDINVLAAKHERKGEIDHGNSK